MDVFEAKEELLKELKWSENPFVKDLRVQDQEMFMKYYCPLESAALLEKLAFDTKACLLLGPKGVGKTSALYFVYYSLPDGDFTKTMLKEPPGSIEALAASLGYPFRTSALDSVRALFGKKKEQKLTREELAAWLKESTASKKHVVFLDETQLAAPKMYMEYKYLLDEVAGLRFVFSALDNSAFPDSLMHIIGEKNVFTRSKFAKGEMVDVINHRITAVGGNAPAPFTAQYLEKTLTEQNLLSPRYVFDELNGFLAELATGKKPVEVTGETVIQAKVKLAPSHGKTKAQVEKAESEYAHDPIVQSAIKRSRDMQLDDVGRKLTTAHANWWGLLSPSQQTVLAELLRNDSLTLSELMAKTGMTENTVFNALYQLRGDDKAERERKPTVPYPVVMAKVQMVGKRKRNLYAANAKIKNMFTTH